MSPRLDARFSSTSTLAAVPLGHIWRYEPTASVRTCWHLYCLDTYRVVSGQYPDEIQHTLCEICGAPSDEMDHRLAIEVARALGPAAMLRAFTPENLRCLCRSYHRRKTRRIGDWRSYCRRAHWTGTAVAQAESQVGAVAYAAVQPGAFSAADKRGLMAACGHEVPDRSGRRCAVCKKCLHRDITIEGARATCRDCNKTFIGW